MSEIIFQYNGYNQIIEYKNYPSGEPMIKTYVDTTERNVSPIDHDGILFLRPKSMDAFIAAMFWVDAWVERGGKVPELVLPLVPGSRQDRLMNKGSDYLFTAKSIAKMINARNFPKVTILDPHSEVISALIDRCHVISAGEILTEFASRNDHRDFFFYKNNIQSTGTSIGMKEYYKIDGVIAPDAGSIKRASDVAQRLEIPLYHGGKSRDTKTGKISNFWVHDIDLAYGSLLIVDDLCDGGGTFVGLADEIRKHNREVELNLYVTHGLFTKGLDVLNTYFVNIITTDSTLCEEKVKVISVCNQIMKGW